MHFCLFSVPNLNQSKQFFKVLQCFFNVEDVLKILRSIDFIEIRIQRKIALFINSG